MVYYYFHFIFMYLRVFRKLHATTKPKHICMFSDFMKMQIANANLVTASSHTKPQKVPRLRKRKKISHAI